MYRKQSAVAKDWSAEHARNLTSCAVPDSAVVPGRHARTLAERLRSDGSDDACAFVPRNKRHRASRASRRQPHAGPYGACILRSKRLLLATRPLFLILFLADDFRQHMRIGRETFQHVIDSHDAIVPNDRNPAHAMHPHPFEHLGRILLCIRDDDGSPHNLAHQSHRRVTALGQNLHHDIPVGDDTQRR